MRNPNTRLEKQDLESPQQKTQTNLARSNIAGKLHITTTQYKTASDFEIEHDTARWIVAEHLFWGANLEVYLPLLSQEVEQRRKAINSLVDYCGL